MSRRRRNSGSEALVELIAALCSCGFSALFFGAATLAKQSSPSRIADPRRTWRPSNVDLNHLSGREFEQYLAFLLGKMGYRVELTPVSGDKGVDLIAQRGDERIAIQAKRYSGKVPRSAVSDAVAGMRLYRCNLAMVMTNSTFSKGAHEVAHANDCKLVDGVGLAELARQYLGPQTTADVYVDSETDSSTDGWPHHDLPRRHATADELNLAEYGIRNRLLLELGFADYEEYCESPVWQAIRERVLDRDQYVCRGCGGRGYQVHHLRYDRDTLLGHDLHWLITICRECHEWIEHDSTGRKLSVTAANRQLELLLARTASADSSPSDFDGAELSDHESASSLPVIITETSSNVSIGKQRRDVVDQNDSLDPVLVAVLARDRHRCRACGGRASGVYAWGSETRAPGNQDVDWLLAVCARCENDARAAPDGAPRDKEQADLALARMIEGLQQRRSPTFQLKRLIDGLSSLPGLLIRGLTRLGRSLTRWLNS